MLKYILNSVLLLFVLCLSAQEQNKKSIHQEESIIYKPYTSLTPLQFDEMHKSVFDCSYSKQERTLEKTVFGYEPFWGGNRYLNYRWDLLTDLCYFSYEVNPETGFATDLHNFDNIPVIDTALAHGIKVHLCVTLFNGQATFFNDSASNQNLINELITKVSEREIHGINLDFEAVPSSQSEKMTAFVEKLYLQVKDTLPHCIISMATPAVNWSGTFQLEELNDFVDLFVIMAYDYYWNGSDFAGPVAAKYSLQASYDYNVSRTISYYQTKDIPNEKLVLGMPYYGRKWETASSAVPTTTIRYGVALTYSNIKNNSNGWYSLENQFWNEQSFANYFAFQSVGNWYQCFIDSPRSLGKRFDIINRRQLGGIAIWALGYDNGSDDFWNLIENKFTETSADPHTDTLYDSGGPFADYYNYEDYSITLDVSSADSIKLCFYELGLESSYDSLFIYDGADTTAPLLLSLTGNEFPNVIYSTSNKICLRFRSDGTTTAPGWMIITNCKYALDLDENNSSDFSIYPNPTDGKLFISGIQHTCSYSITNIQGNTVQKGEFKNNNPAKVDISLLPNGIYFLQTSFFISKIIKN